MKKLLALMCALALLLAATASAEQFSVKTDELAQTLHEKYADLNIADLNSGEKISMLISYDSALFTSFDDWWWWDFMETITGVTVEPVLVDKTVYNEQLAIILTSGDMPDVIWHGFSNSEIVDYGVRQSLFLPLNEYVENRELMPRLNAALDRFPEARTGSYCYDGNIYGLPIVNSYVMNTASALRAIFDNNWLKAAGIEDYQSLETLDDFYNALKASVAVDFNGNGEADEVGWSQFWGNDGKNGMQYVVAYILSAYNISTTNGILGIDLDTNQGGLTALMDDYYPALQFLHKLYEEKLLDNDLFSQTDPDLTTKMSNGQNIFSTYWNPGYMLAYANDGNDAFWNYELIWQTPFVAEAGQTPIAPVGSRQAFNRSVITKDCDNVELAVKWLDVCYDPWVSKCYWHGPTFGTEEDYFQIGVATSPDDPLRGSWEEAKTIHGVPEMNDSEFLSRNNTLIRASVAGVDDTFWSCYTEEGIAKTGGEAGYHALKDWCQQYLDEIAPYEVLNYPNLYFTEDDVRTINDFTSDVETYVIENTAKFIAGDLELNDENWAAFKAGVLACGGNELNKVYADGYAAYMANEE